MTIEQVRALASTLPRTTEALVRDRVKFRVRRIVFLAFSRDESMMGFAFPREERDALVASDPGKFLLPKPADLRYHWVVVRLAAIDEVEMRELVEDAWRMVVPPTLAFDASADGEPARRCSGGHLACAAMGACTTRGYGGGSDDEVGTDLEHVSEILKGGCSVVWVDLEDPAPGDLKLLAAELGLHVLSVEDALESHQRDKYVHYDRHVFLICHDITLDVDQAELTTVELDVFIGDRWLVTVHRGGEGVMERVAHRWQGVRQTGGESVGFAIYALLDVVVDGYFTVLDRFEQFYDAAADQIFGEMTIEPSEQRKWFEMRKALNQFERSVGPLSYGGDARSRSVPRQGGPVPARRPDRARPRLLRGRRVARAGAPHRRPEPPAARLPAERDHEEGHQLGGDNRRPHPGHRVVRHERSVPRFGRAMGSCLRRDARHRLFGRAVGDVPQARLAVIKAATVWPSRPRVSASRRGGARW
ncbi:MAG: CorA family divalent cation transporter [Ilumatobacteraceae bacterium]